MILEQYCGLFLRCTTTYLPHSVLFLKKEHPSPVSWYQVSQQADTAYGVFCLFNMIIYMVYAIILSVHRRSVISSDLESSTAGAYKGEDQDNGVVNPDMDRAYGDAENEL